MSNENQRVPTLAPDGTVLMPTKASRARRWLKEGKAEVVPNNLQVFQIRLLFEPSGTETQEVVAGIDPGSKYTGIGVQSKNDTLLTCHLNLPFERVHKRMNKRRELRRSRRGRRVGQSRPFADRAHRQKRFNNRRKGKFAPSIRANREMELRIVDEISRLYPVSCVVYEYVKARTTGRNPRWFSAVMVGQKKMLGWLAERVETHSLFGWQTSNLRKHLGLEKSGEKGEEVVASHAVDGIALACSRFVRYAAHETGMIWKGDVVVTKSPFIAINRPGYFRRMLHFEKKLKGGSKKRKGGTVTPWRIRSGDYVEAEKAGVTVHGWVGGYTESEKSKTVAIYNRTWKRIGQFAPSKVKLLKRNTRLCVNIIGYRQSGQMVEWTLPQLEERSLV